MAYRRALDYEPLFPRPKARPQPLMMTVPTNSGTVGARVGGRQVDVNAGYTGSTYTGAGNTGTTGATNTGYVPGVSARGSAGTSLGLIIPSAQPRRRRSGLAAGTPLQDLIWQRPAAWVPHYTDPLPAAAPAPQKKSGSSWFTRAVGDTVGGIAKTGGGIADATTSAARGGIALADDVGNTAAHVVSRGVSTAWNASGVVRNPFLDAAGFAGGAAFDVGAFTLRPTVRTLLAGRDVASDVAGIGIRALDDSTRVARTVAGVGVRGARVVARGVDAHVSDVADGVSTALHGIGDGIQYTANAAQHVGTGVVKGGLAAAAFKFNTAASVVTPVARTAWGLASAGADAGWAATQWSANAALNTGRVGMRAVTGTDKFSELPGALWDQAKINFVSGAMFNPGIAALNMYHNLGDPLGLRGTMESISERGAFAGLLKNTIGVEPTGFMKEAFKVLDASALAGSVFLATESTNDWAKGEGSFGNMVRNNAMTTAAAASFAIPELRAGGVLARVAGRAVLRETELLTTEAVLQTLSNLDAAESLGSRYLWGPEDQREPIPWNDMALRAAGLGYMVRARGGRVQSGETTLVGERGPEIVRLPGGSQVMPAHRSRELMERMGMGAGGFGPQADRELHIHQHLDGREIARSTLRNFDDDEQWGRL
ncbi:hypothetical protein Q5424_09380 [Conexibacter sp. JD483]|uniref:hypothetical protein n=1 Tax=unclassified Conexibacter TaxID=2627773 RepID=UPI0027245675|nr:MULTISPECIES: hypothetical protein [unclassified Conexibacter]MDO8187212.1 hypothetical protein [Conexibacter sp. CPCC 205706]MDO8199309.1 hypothetical protein [Conexibacter sp. CPCC 205762]MDR9369290.1 hypothetical protein [Conexibacter sp. JD483]